MKITILKRLVVILMAVMILASAAVGVSANYVDMLDHGLYFSASTSISTGINIYDSGGAGTYENTVKSWIPMWALDSYEPGTTYTMKFSCTVPQGKVLSFSDTTVLRYHDKTSSIKSQLELQGAYGSASYNEATSTVEFTVKFNTDISNLGGYPIYIYLYCPISSQVYNRNTTNQWSTSVEYDPGGSKFLEDYLDHIVNYGDGNDLPDGSEMKSQGSAMSSAEGAVRDKSSDLVSSVAEDWTQYQTVAKNAAVSLKPAAATVNNIYALILDAVPEEVIALFIAIALLLFIGWLIGRVRE